MQKITHERVKVLLLSHKIASFFIYIYDSFTTCILYNLGTRKCRTVAASSLSSVSSTILIPPLRMYCVIWKYIVGVGGEEGVIRSEPGWWRVVVHDSTIGCVGRCVTASIGYIKWKQKKKNTTVKMHWMNLLDASEKVYFLFLYVCLTKITNKDMSRISKMEKGFELCTSLL